MTLEGLSSLPLELRQIAHQFTRAADEHLAPAGISLSRFVVLAAIKASPGIHGRPLAAQTMQTPQSLGSITTLLESEGLLERGTQGRKVTYTLTDRGRDSLSRGIHALAQLQASLLGALTPSQLTGLQDGLAALRGRLAEIGQE
ncbi:MarR family winged helix-turn-helix transcriptional regulator [Streptomyces griseoruber]|uniref:MarR family winged helix-turn-helix transcriptional regulator n=1 Tax=Streptomyces griseoruber TaxID=1943 RepID=UPI00378AE29E